MAKRALADVLWEAANERLDHIPHREASELEEFSCHAMYRAAFGRHWRRRQSTEAVDGFVMALGCNPGRAMDRDYGVEQDTEQGVRYMWLLLAMKVAEDEKIMVEVS